MLKTLSACALVLTGVLLIAPRVQAQTSDGESSLTQAEKYCTQTGGQVYFRQAEYGTNGGTPLLLAEIKPFCQYTSATDGSRIHVLLSTLVATEPTLAALAYYEKPPDNTPTCVGNPASCYCTLIGGSDLFGGVNAAGGGWVNNNSTDQVLEACIFPDLSSIDSWGLAYNTNGAIRGIDLTTVLRYKFNPSAKP